MEIQPTKFVSNIIESNFEAIRANTDGASTRQCHMPHNPENYNKELSTFVTRVIYAGDHSFANPSVNLKAYLHENISESNASNMSSPAYGFILMYEKHYVIVLEASEETITKQIKLLISKSNKLLRSKLLIAYHNIKERWFPSWRSFYATPPRLFTKMNPSAPIEFHMETLDTCTSKLIRLCKFVMQDDQLNFDGMAVLDPRVESLPESALLDYILASQFVMDLKEYARLFDILPEYTFTFERCWPPPCDFTPNVKTSLDQRTSFVNPLPKEPGFEGDDVEEEVVVVKDTKGDDGDEED